MKVIYALHYKINASGSDISASDGDGVQTLDVHTAASVGDLEFIDDLSKVSRHFESINRF